MMPVLLDGAARHQAYLPHVDGIIDLRPGQFFVAVFGCCSAWHGVSWLYFFAQTRCWLFISTLIETESPVSHEAEAWRSRAIIQRAPVKPRREGFTMRVHKASRVIIES